MASDKKSDPCWDDYEMVGMKKGKGGKPVPDCVPKSSDNAEEDYSELSVPEGWNVKKRKPHREGQHDKSSMLDAEMNPSDEANMSEDEYEYWKSACSSCASMAESDGKKYTHTYKDKKTGKTRKVRYGAQGYKIAPGTKRGDSYCARSEGDMKSEGMDCSGPDRNTPMCLSRKKWECKGAKSTG